MASEFFLLFQGHFGDASEAYDFFGHSLAAGDFNGDNISDLAIGAPLEALTSVGGAIADAGMVNVVYGLVGLNLLMPIAAQSWTQLYILPPTLF